MQLTIMDQSSWHRNKLLPNPPCFYIPKQSHASKEVLMSLVFHPLSPLLNFKRGEGGGGRGEGGSWEATSLVPMQTTIHQV